MDYVMRVNGGETEGASCPSDEQLAQWLDGRLDTVAAHAVESHVADCAACAELVAAIGAGLTAWDESGTSSRSMTAAVSVGTNGRSTEGTSVVPMVVRKPRRSLRTWLAVAAAVVIGLGALTIERLQRPDIDADVRQLSAVQGGMRSTYGRLVAFEWAAPPRTFRAGVGPASSEALPLLDSAAALEEKYRDDDSPEARHARGLALLLAGELDRAVPLLDGARVSRPRDVRYLNDAAVAHLQRAWRRSDRQSLRLALDLSHQVVALDPDSPEGWYNLAMAARLADDDNLLRRATDTLARIEPRSEWTAELLAPER